MKLAVSLCVFILFFIQGCDFKSSSQSSFLVIAVDSLSYDKVLCNNQDESNKHQGFHDLCTESVRFTHAYTPSLMSQSALASILTGMYPYENQVWQNGSNYLSSFIKTVPEVAIEKGYRTAFFSGGPTIFKKSGLHQGFETFFDRLDLKLDYLYRPARENFKLLLDWLVTRSNTTPFFSMVYLSDLQFPNVATKTDYGELRSPVQQGQLDEINESLDYLFNALKRHKKWDNTNIILVGLNGQSPTEKVKALDLSHENTRVTMLIKPAQKARDLGLNWKIDKNVSLVDLGATLYDLLEADIPSPTSRLLDVVSLKKILTSPDTYWNADRPILIESGWPLWNEIGLSRMGLRKGNHFIKYDKDIKVYNTLIDRNELYPIGDKDPLWDKLTTEAEIIFKQLNFMPFEMQDEKLIEKILVAKKLFLSKSPDKKTIYQIEELSKKRFWDDQLKLWLANIALKNKDWSELKQIAKQLNNPLWVYVANKNLGKVDKPPQKKCGVLFQLNTQSFQRPSPQTCDNELLLKAIEWILEKESYAKAVKFEKFWREYNYYLIDQKIGEYNYINDLQWDVKKSLPSGPLLVDLFLSLPKSRSYLKKLNLRIKARE
ncbi:MAG: sulfatase-like hydrolase/transferase [Bdellovibrionales bacterium]|nr:sulfatase-like hydrolase/transferase [Bdellovibrionales bacterium]